MHYDARPTWRYQWPALFSIFAMVFIVALSEFYGPAHTGMRITHLVSSAAAALAVYFLLLMFYRHLAWRYLIDDLNIESYQGVLARRVHSIRIADLRSINVNQTVMQRLLGVGDVEFSSAAGGEVEVVFFGVADPMQLKHRVQRLQIEGAEPTE
jgi:uncharacterized membrane protein YdbT with pleckstrin-like domain